MSFCAKTNRHNEHLIPYDEALVRIERVACTSVEKHDRCNPSLNEAFICRNREEVRADRASVTLQEAVGCKSSQTLYAPHSTPRADTSAMDGFAVSACGTAGASEDYPLKFRIVDSIAAGDNPVQKPPVGLDFANSHVVCVEIMTGACFPETTLPHLDSVVKVEDVIVGEDWSDDGAVVSRYIQLRQPVKALQHRRPAGSDFLKGETIIKQGTTVEPKHVAALASLGYTHIEVSAVVDSQVSFTASTNSMPILRIGVLSTGSEIVNELNRVRQSHQLYTNSKQTIPDSNGPYLVSNLKAACPSVAIEHLGIVQDDEERLTEHLSKAIFEDDFDIIITSGGVSRGRHDLVRYVIETRLGGRVIFHGAKIRPGAPVLFAAFDNLDGVTFKANRRVTAFFGAPGNPLAAAVALRFFVIPYVLKAGSANLGSTRTLELPDRGCGNGESVIVSRRQQEHDNGSADLRPLHRKPKDTTVFWLARRQAVRADGVEVIDDQASYKLRGLLEADCWITVPAGSSEIYSGDQFLSTPL